MGTEQAHEVGMHGIFDGDTSDDTTSLPPLDALLSDPADPDAAAAVPGGRRAGLIRGALSGLMALCLCGAVGLQVGALAATRSPAPGTPVVVPPPAPVALAPVVTPPPAPPVARLTVARRGIDAAIGAGCPLRPAGDTPTGALRLAGAGPALRGLVRGRSSALAGAPLVVTVGTERHRYRIGGPARRADLAIAVRSAGRSRTVLARAEGGRVALGATAACATTAGGTR